MDVCGHTHILIRNSVGRLPHQFLDMLYAAHLGVYLLKHLGALLQAEYDVLLDLRELDVGRQLLELLELAIGLGEQRLLVLLAAQGEQGALLVALGQHLLGDLGLAVGEDGYAPLVLVQLVALGFEIKDGPLGEESISISHVLVRPGRMHLGRESLVESMDARDAQAASLVLGRDPTGAVAHGLASNICRGANQQY